MYSPGTSLRTSITRRICCFGPNPFGTGPGFPSSSPSTYAIFGGMRIRLAPPVFMPLTAWSNPATAPVRSPTVKTKGTESSTADESTKYPFDRRRTHCKFTRLPSLTSAPVPTTRSAYFTPLPRVTNLDSGSTSSVFVIAAVPCRYSSPRLLGASPFLGGGLLPSTSAEATCTLPAATTRPETSDRRDMKGYVFVLLESGSSLTWARLGISLIIRYLEL
mmetsp:Transcript_59986/g.82115  ORF Transcript_59986/g.82115 Transcript_59986/m.82115 type:complete len:219 (+) Transcript_59986:196-852(+)